MSANGNQTFGESKDCRLSEFKQSEQQNMTGNITLVQGVSSEGILSMLRQRHQEDRCSASTSQSSTQHQQHSFPVFPSLGPPVLKSVSDAPSLQMNSHDIAKEAMRLTRETLLAEEQHPAVTAESLNGKSIQQLGQLHQWSMCDLLFHSLLIPSSRYCLSTRLTFLRFNAQRHLKHTILLPLPVAESTGRPVARKMMHPWNCPRRNLPQSKAPRTVPGAFGSTSLCVASTTCSSTKRIQE